MGVDIKKEANWPNDDQTLSVNGVIFTHNNLFKVVDDFYMRIQNDPILQVPFKSVENWQEHIQRLTHFWWVRFGGTPYMFNEYNPVMKHFYAGFNRELLARWLSIFNDTLHTHLKPDQINIWKLISERMGEALALKNEAFKKSLE